MATPRGKTQRIGDRFGRLTIISAIPECRLHGGKKKRWWLCRCDCGTERYFQSTKLRRGKSTSCGCKRLDNLMLGTNAKYSFLTTSLNGKRTYGSWKSMVARCCNPEAINFKNYGGRGIMVCDRWRQSYQNFLDDMGLRPEGLTLGRKDNNGDYEPDNCRWETAEQQYGNKRNTVFIEGEKLIDICVEAGADRNLIYQRHIALGWPLKKAIKKRVKRYKKKLPVFTE